MIILFIYYNVNLKVYEIHFKINLFFDISIDIRFLECMDCLYRIVEHNHFCKHIQHYTYDCIVLEIHLYRHMFLDIEYRTYCIVHWDHMMIRNHSLNTNQ